MPVALNASCRFKRSSCSFESFFCVTNRFVHSISVVRCCPTYVVRCLPTSVVRCRLIAVARCRPTSAVRCRPTAVARCRPTSVTRCRPTSIASCRPTSVARCRPNSHFLLRWMTLLWCCDLCDDVTIRLPGAAACCNSPLPRYRDRTSCRYFFFRMLEPVPLCTGPYNY